MSPRSAHVPMNCAPIPPCSSRSAWRLHDSSPPCPPSRRPSWRTAEASAQRFATRSYSVAARWSRRWATAGTTGVREVDAPKPELVSGIDSAWLHMDEPANRMVVTLVLIFEHRLSRHALDDVLQHRLVHLP